MSRYVPNAGDLIWLTFDPQAGSEQAGRRPALVLSPKAYNAAAGLAVLCPVTSRSKGYPFEVPLSGEADVQGVVLSDHVKNLDWRTRNATFISQATPEVLSEVRAKLRPLLGLD